LQLIHTHVYNTCKFLISHKQPNRAKGSIMEQTVVNVNIETSVPIMHPDKFAEAVGRTPGVIGGWIDQGYLPTVKVGRYQMVNLVLLIDNLKQGRLL